MKSGTPFFNRLYFRICLAERPDHLIGAGGPHGGSADKTWFKTLFGFVWMLMLVGLAVQGILKLESLSQAREVIKIWRKDYNEVRLHSSCGRVPATYAAPFQSIVQQLAA